MLHCRCVQFAICFNPGVQFVICFNLWVQLIRQVSAKGVGFIAGCHRFQYRGAVCHLWVVSTSVNSGVQCVTCFNQEVQLIGQAAAQGIGFTAGRCYSLYNKHCIDVHLHESSGVCALRVAVRPVHARVSALCVPVCSGVFISSDSDVYICRQTCMPTFGSKVYRCIQAH